MGRKYKKPIGGRRYQAYSNTQLQKAIRALKTRNITYQEAQDLYNIPKKTLWNKINNQHMKRVGGQPVLSEVEERQIVDVLLAAAEYGSPLTSMDLRMVVKKYFDRSGRTVAKFSENLPGSEWCLNFIERHSNMLSKRSCQNIKGVRAQKCEEEIQAYFDNLSTSLEGVLKENILNFDETNLSDDPGSSKCLFRKGIKYPERVMNTTKTCISIMFAIAGDGSVLPPYVVYKAERLYDQWTLGGPQQCRYNRTKSGWFDTDTFEDWFLTLAIPWAKAKKGTKVIIGDNLSSHLNVNILIQCQRQGIRFVFLPAQSTHLTQPLDVGYYGPLKRVWKKRLQSYKLQNPREKSSNKVSFPPLLKQLVDKLQLSDTKNIESAFRATGIIPLDAHQVLKRLPSYRGAKNLNSTVSDTLLDYLKDIRTPSSTQPNRQARKKMIKVVPGQSVSYEEIQSTSKGDKETSENESSESESNNEPAEDIDFEDSEVPKNIEILKEPEEGHFVMVKFCTKKTVRHYVGQIVEVCRPDIIIKFLRKKMNNTFVFPQSDDVSSQHEDDIVQYLDRPTVRRGLHTFNINVQDYNL